MKKRCQRYQRGTLNSMRPFSFFGQKIFFLSISISTGRSGENEASKVPTGSTEQNATIFVFRSKNFFLDLSISGGRSGKREVSRISTRSPEQYASNLVLRIKKIFLDISIFWRSYR